MDAAKEKYTEVDEEFVNFEHKVEEIGSIVRGLCSKNESESKRAERKADLYLVTDKEFDENEVRVKCSRTVINKKPSTDETNSGTMSQAAFMAAVEKDAKERSEDRKRRKEIAENYKRSANDAFYKEDYTKAVDMYSKALDQVKDSTILYINRALSYSRLGVNKRVIEDCDMALRLNENSLRAWLLKGKALRKLGKLEESNVCVKEAEDRNPDYKSTIEMYVKQWEDEPAAEKTT